VFRLKFFSDDQGIKNCMKYLMKRPLNKMAQRLIAALFLMVGMALNNAVMAGEAEDIAVISKVLAQVMPQGKADSIKATPFPGMYEALFGPQIIYISADGHYIFEGDLYDLKNRLNLTEAKRRVGRAQAVSRLDEKDMIVFAPAANKVKYTITAFTDIDCGYCRKMHKQMQQYNDLGIAFRYLAYPRSGVDTPSYYKAVSVWCADDRKAAMTKAKLGTTPPKVACDNPIKTHMEAAKLVGVTGTPTLVLESGRVIPGYVEPLRLMQMLEQLNAP
jgi:thiol:disulfide interchange protein DsbC